jgi:threonine synthase
LEVPIKVKGFDASIKRIFPLIKPKRLLVHVKLKKDISGLSAVVVIIPAKKYSREELLQVVVEKAEKFVEKWLSLNEKEKKDWEKTKKLLGELLRKIPDEIVLESLDKGGEAFWKEFQKVNNLAKKLSAEIGLEF